MTNQPSIYQIALERPEPGLAGRLRVVIAQVAVSDPTWCQTYDALVEATKVSGLRHPETYVLEHDAAQREPVYIVSSSFELREAAATILRQASHLGAQDQGASDLDLVSAVIGAEVWLAAVDADNLAYAAAKGPDAISSAAALLARACGQGVSTMPLDPDWPTLRFPQQQIINVLEHCRAWSNHVLGEHAWGEVTARVVTDLAFYAGGGTKTHDASLLLGVRMLDINPHTS